MKVETKFEVGDFVRFNTKDLDEAIQHDGFNMPKEGVLCGRVFDIVIEIYDKEKAWITYDIQDISNYHGQIVVEEEFLETDESKNKQNN